MRRYGKYGLFQKIMDVVWGSRLYSDVGQSGAEDVFRTIEQCDFRVVRVSDIKYVLEFIQKEYEDLRCEPEGEVFALEARAPINVLATMLEPYEELTDG